MRALVLRSRRCALCAFLTSIAACGPSRMESPAAEALIAREELPGPSSWRVVARSDGKVLLAASRVIRRIRRRADLDQPTPGREGEYGTLIFDNGRLRDGPVAHERTIALPLEGGSDSIRAYAVELDGRQVLFTQPGDGPPLHESPIDPGRYVAEHGNRLWLLTPSGATQLTADTVARIARDTLWPQQREGVRHLFWAATPLWSPDGSAIAYGTNRTWMLDPRGGQEVWLVEPRTRRERALLSERGGFFSSNGWLGAELVYSAREGPISALDARSGSRRAIDTGAVAAILPSPPRMLYMTPAGDTRVRARIVKERSAVMDVPDPPAGERFDYRGAFSPSGNRLLLGTSFARDSGMTRALYVFDVPTRRLTRVMQWSHREGTRHPDGSPGVWLDESTVLLTQLDRTTGLELSLLLRLPRAHEP